MVISEERRAGVSAVGRLSVETAATPNRISEEEGAACSVCLPGGDP